VHGRKPFAKMLGHHFDKVLFCREVMMERGAIYTDGRRDIAHAQALETIRRESTERTLDDLHAAFRSWQPPSWRHCPCLRPHQHWVQGIRL